MSRPGHRRGLLDDLHADGCQGNEFTTCEPVVRDDPEDQGDRVTVVVMEWCGNCGAADWEVV